MAKEGREIIVCDLSYNYIHVKLLPTSDILPAITYHSVPGKHSKALYHNFLTFSIKRVPCESNQVGGDTCMGVATCTLLER